MIFGILPYNIPFVYGICRYCQSVSVRSDWFVFFCSINYLHDEQGCLSGKTTTFIAQRDWQLNLLDANSLKQAKHCRGNVDNCWLLTWWGNMHSSSSIDFPVSTAVWKELIESLVIERSQVIVLIRIGRRTGWSS